MTKNYFFLYPMWLPTLGTSIWDYILVFCCTIPSGHIKLLRSRLITVSSLIFFGCADVYWSFYEEFLGSFMQNKVLLYNLYFCYIPMSSRTHVRSKHRLGLLIFDALLIHCFLQLILLFVQCVGELKLFLWWFVFKPSIIFDKLLLMLSWTSLRKEA